MAGVLTHEHAATAAAQDVHHGQVSHKDLIRGLARLRWTLWKRSYRKNIGKLIGTIIGALYGIGAMVALVFIFLGTTLWAGEGTVFPAIIRGLGALTVLLWVLIPLFAFGVDDTLDPRAFALYPRSARNLQPGMAVAAALSLPSLFTLIAILIATGFEALWLVLFGQGIGWVVAAMIALLPANLAGFVLCLLLPRAVFAHSASRASSRSGRERGGIVAFLGMFVLIYAASLLMQRIPDAVAVLDLSLLSRIVEGLAWTPVGALFSVPMDLAEGRALTAALRALIGAATIVLVWLWWRRSIDASLTSALAGDASSGTTSVSPLVPRFVPSGPFGAVLGKSLRYWRRDTRYLAALGIYPIVVVFLVAIGFVLPESRAMMLGMAIFMLGMSGLSLANEIGFDGPSGWVNITASLPARANLLGRVAAQALLMGPPALLLATLIPLVFGMPEMIGLFVLGVTGAMIAGWGISMLIATLVPYPASPPGTNPMKDKSASSANAMLAMTVSMLVLLVALAPAIGVGIWGAAVGSTGLTLLAGGLAILAGAIVFVVGLLLAERRLEAQYPDLFQKVRDYAS